VGQDRLIGEMPEAVTRARCRALNDLCTHAIEREPSKFIAAAVSR
jgi:hypothetical protein